MLLENKGSPKFSSYSRKCVGKIKSIVEVDKTKRLFVGAYTESGARVLVMIIYFVGFYRVVIG